MLWRPRALVLCGSFCWWEGPGSGDHSGFGREVAGSVYRQEVYSPLLAFYHASLSALVSAQMLKTQLMGSKSRLGRFSYFVLLSGRSRFPFLFFSSTFYAEKLQTYRKLEKWGTCLAVQWLRPCTSTSGDRGLIPDGGTKIPHATWHGQEIK